MCSYSGVAAVCGWRGWRGSLITVFKGFNTQIILHWG